MPLYALDNRLWFPPVETAQEDGLLAIGGDLSVQRLLLAYEKGIFPWYEGDVPVWWSPDPRFVLYPGELKVSKSMQQLFKRNAFSFTVNKAFFEVINNCKKINFWNCTARKRPPTESSSSRFYQGNKCLTNETAA